MNNAVLIQTAVKSQSTATKTLNGADRLDFCHERLAAAPSCDQQEQLHIFPKPLLSVAQ